ARGVDEREAGVLGPVARCVDRSNADGSQGELPAVVERLVLVVRRRLAVDVDRRAGRRGKAPVARHVVRVVVGLEDVLDLHPEVAAELEVLADLEARVHDRRLAGIEITDYVGGAPKVVMDDLTE